MSDERESLSAAWEGQAVNWARWAQKPGHDSYWRFHRASFLALLPPPGALTIDVGCGEGRVARDLTAAGHRVIGIDRSPTLVRLARDGGSQAALADGARLPLGDGCCDLVVAFMSMQDIDEMPSAIAEAGRVLGRGGRLCLAVVHPINAAGKFLSDAPGAPFQIAADYFERRRYTDSMERDGLPMTFNQRHWPLQDYFGALESAGLLVERLREPVPGVGGRWDRLPLFLQVRALKP